MTSPFLPQLGDALKRITSKLPEDIPEPTLNAWINIRHLFPTWINFTPLQKMVAVKYFGRQEFNRLKPALIEKPEQLTWSRLINAVFEDQKQRDVFQSNLDKLNRR